MGHRSDSSHDGWDPSSSLALLGAGSGLGLHSWRTLGISGRGVAWGLAVGRLLPEQYALQLLPAGEQPIEFLLGFSMRFVCGV